MKLRFEDFRNFPEHRHELQEIYESHLPEDERWSFEYLLKAYAKGQKEIYLLFIEEEMVGLLVQTPVEEFLFAEYWAIRQRGKGASSGFYFARDILEFWGDRPVYCEVDPADTGEIARKRIQFYRRSFGFELFDEIPYVQPALQAHTQAVPMHLMARNCKEFLTRFPEIRAEHFRKIYACTDPLRFA